MFSAPVSTSLSAARPRTEAPGRSLLAKRLLDLGITVPGLLGILPILLMIAAAVKLTSRGPVFFVQTRIGRDGKPFGMIKFRSMHVDAEVRRAALLAQSERSGPCFKIKNDPRVTSVGRILRRLSLDELPQLFNVLRGEMSLVGPRPALPEEVARYPLHAHERHRVLPGITGAWQVSGRADLSFNEMIDLDLTYARKGTIATDLGILRRTLAAVLSGHGAY